MDATSSVVIKWSSKEFTVPIEGNDTVADFKRKIAELINVQPKRKKVLGLKVAGGKLAGDEALIGDLALKPGQKLLVMGTPEEAIAAVDRQAEVAPHVQDDFDIVPGELAVLDIADRPENQEKLQRRVSSVEVKLLNPPRAGKKCLVVDIDYTIFDLGSSAERPEELARPYLHDFFSAVYEHYDIIIWSATNMKWINVKMQELGVATHPGYRILCYLDHKAMVTVHTEKYGVFDCKPLPFIWAKFPDQYSEHNTIMLDDLARNYVFNKQNGLVIKPYRKSHTSRATDQELLGLKEYLLTIAPLQSLTTLNHGKWQRYLEKRRTNAP